MGRLKERYWRDAADEYEKRLSRFGRFEEIELADLPEPANSSPAIEAQICEREGEPSCKRCAKGISSSRCASAANSLTRFSSLRP